MWSKLEPIRSYVYTLLAPTEVLLVSYGVVDDVKGALWLALATAVLAVTGVEVARKQVKPLASSE